MYKELQEKVRKHIIQYLNQFSAEWKFDIDTKNENYPVVVGCGPGNYVIRAPIDKIHTCAQKELISGIANKYNTSKKYVLDWGGCMIIKNIFESVFKIYKIKVDCSNTVFCGLFKIINKNDSQWGSRCIYINDDEENGETYASPFEEELLEEYDIKEQLSDSTLLLLDPIKYFRKCYIVCNKYPDLDDDGQMAIIYKILLEYFPEVGKEFVEKCWLLHIVFWDLSTDIANLIVDRFVDLL